MADQQPEAPNDAAAATKVLRRGLASAGVLLLALLLVAFVARVEEANRERDAASALERRSFEAMLLTRNIQAATGQAEAALGRFVISSDRRIGALYRDQWLQADQLIDRLERLVRGNPPQASLVGQLRLAYGARGRELANTANYAAVGRNWEALSLHNRAATSASGPVIARSLGEIEERERGLLERRSIARLASTEESNSLVQTLAFTGVVLALVALTLGWTTARAFNDRLKARQRAETLEDAVSARTSELQRANADLRAEALERAAAEERLRQVQKMEAVGQLTGGIAHDFNNMLAVVVGGLDLARCKLGLGSHEAARHIDRALDGANRAAALTRRLLTFARAQPLLPHSCDPVVLIRGLHDLIERSIGERIAVTIAADDRVWPVWTDSHQLENAVLNLAVNARDAMDGGGILTIAIANVALGDGEIGEAAAGDYVRIAVSDTGQGMTPEVMERVFEPFFTTKPTGQGTGLGLSQILGFARQSGGEVSVESSPGSGSTFALYLPRFTRAASESAAAAVSEPIPAAAALAAE